MYAIRSYYGESRLAKDHRGLGRASARAAHGDQRSVRGELRQAIPQLTQGDTLCAGDAAQPLAALLWLAHIQQLHFMNMTRNNFV